MKKIHAWLLIWMLAPLLAGLYGMLHDQLTYTLSSEYYFKFKFVQFDLVNGSASSLHPRLTVLMVGFMATWWVGTIIGFILATVGLMHQDAKLMLRTSLKGLLINIVVAMCIGLLGWCYGHFVASHESPKDYTHWYIPEHLSDFKSFVTVGWIHNAGYMGGMIGLVVAVIYSIMKHRKSLSQKLGQL